jgi:hypothetical protein
MGVGAVVVLRRLLQFPRLLGAAQPVVVEHVRRHGFHFGYFNESRKVRSGKTQMMAVRRGVEPMGRPLGGSH